MPNFDLNLWGFLLAAAFALIAGLTWQVRIQRRRQRLVNQELSRRRCSQCGGTFATWQHQMSRAEYTQVDEYHVPFVLDVVCSECGTHCDAFWHDDGDIQLQPPWDAS